MSGNVPDFGPFGSQMRLPHAQKPSFFRSFLKFFFLFFSAVLVPLALFGWSDFYKNIIEREPPIIELKKPPVGLGLDPSEFSFVVRDKNSGLELVKVRLEQAGRQILVKENKYPSTRPKSDEITLMLNAKDYMLKEGEATLTISAFDASFWSNATKIPVQLSVDYQKPEIVPFASQHNAVYGGSELVFYRLRDNSETFSGIKVGADLYPGFAAKNYDKDFENFPDVYCVFIPVPRDFDNSGEQIRLFARDAVGNMGFASIPYHLQPIGQKQSVIAFTNDVLDSRIDKLYEEFLTKQERLTGDANRRVAPATSEEERITRLRAVNQDYRVFVEKALKPIFSRPKAERFWDGNFARYGGREVRGFGEKVSLQLGGKEIGQYVSQGVSFAIGSDPDVRAANRGVVIFADTLGVYGKTMIIDHGFGLTTLYGNLASMNRLEGDRVERGDVIGKVGDTGLVLSPTLTFEVRLHGVPVRPIEWWDVNWLNDHIEGKLRAMKKELGIRVTTPLE